MLKIYDDLMNKKANLSVIGLGYVGMISRCFCQTFKCNWLRFKQR